MTVNASERGGVHDNNDVKVVAASPQAACLEIFFIFEPVYIVAVVADIFGDPIKNKKTEPVYTVAVVAAAF